MASTWAVVVAAGRGTRFADSAESVVSAESVISVDPVISAKQFLGLGGERMVDRAVRTAAGCCDGVVLVLAPGVEWDGPEVDAAVAGGTRRSDSVRAGLAAVPADVDVVVVHDAARPLATPALFDAVVGAVRAGADAAVPGVPVVDTVKRVVGHHVGATVARDDLVLVQTPQAFRSDILRAAHAGEIDASDDAALVEANGASVVVVAGDPRNLKVTTSSDLRVAEALLASSCPDDGVPDAGAPDVGGAP